jgi:branched-chain amino acid transport system substrate-binding protein
MTKRGAVVGMLPVLLLGGLAQASPQARPAAAERPARRGPAVGIFVPAGGEQAQEGLMVRRGAEMAVAAVNAAGGINGLPLRLVVASADSSWQSGSRELVRLIYEEEAWGVVGGLDSRSAHLAAQVVTRARGRVVLLSPWASDPTLTQIKIPWFFRLVPDDRRQAAALSAAVFAAGRRCVAAVVDSSPDARLAAESFMAASPPGAVILLRAEPETDGAGFVPRLRRSAAEGIVLFMQPAEAAQTARRLRRAGVDLPLFGPLELAGPQFLAQAGEAGEGAVVVAPPAPGARAQEFGRRFEAAYGESPAPLVLYAHDAVLALAQAMRRSGGRREEMAKVLLGGSLTGLTGAVRFEASGERAGPAALAQARGGRLVDAGAAP